MRQYEVTFIVDPVLANDAIEGTARNYAEHLKNTNCEIVHVDAMGLRQLVYPINKRTSGVYFCIEFQAQEHDIIERLELALRRDERIMRFLTVKLDKYGVKYNEDKRNGLIGKRKEVEAALVEDMKSPASQPQGPTPIAATTAPATESVTETTEVAEESAPEVPAETVIESPESVVEANTEVSEIPVESTSEISTDTDSENGATEPIADAVAAAVETVTDDASNVQTDAGDESASVSEEE